MPTIKKPVFIPTEKYRHANVAIDVGRRKLRVTKQMIGETYRPLVELGYAKQIGEIEIETPDPKPVSKPEPKPEPIPETESEANSEEPAEHETGFQDDESDPEPKPEEPAEVSEEEPAERKKRAYHRRS